MGLFSKKKGLDALTPEKEQQKPAKSAGNPYLNGREEWLERYGSYIKREQNWKMACFLALVITGLSITGNVIQANQVKTIPYIVEVDKLGKTVVVNRADKASAQPLRLIQAELAAAIVNWRTVTADIELQQQMIEGLSFFFAGSAKGTMKEWFSKNNPYEIAKTGKLVHVEIKSLPLPVSNNSYRVEWLETIRSHAGVTLDVNRYEATATIQIEPPTTEAVLIHNPGGVYITEISASKILTEKPKAAPVNGANQ